MPCKEDVSGGNEEEDSLLAPPLPTRRDIALSEDQLLDAQPMSESTDHERLDVSSQEMNPSSPDPTYAQPVLPKSSKPACPPVTERVVYDNIDKVQNKEVSFESFESIADAISCYSHAHKGLLYALTKLESSSKEMVVDDLHQVVYSEIQPHSESDSKSQNVQSVPDCSEQASNSTTGSYVQDYSPMFKTTLCVDASSQLPHTQILLHNLSLLNFSSRTCYLWPRCGNPWGNHYL